MTGVRGWVADPGVTWRMALTATLAEPLDAAAARRALDDLYARQGTTHGGEVVVGDDVERLRTELGERRDDALVVGLAGCDVVVSAHHSRLDGLGLLAVLSAVTDSPVTSSARGVGDRPDDGGAPRAVGRRLLEVGLAPPAAVPGVSGRRRGADRYLDAAVPQRLTTTDLVTAATRALRTLDPDLRRVAVAVGLSRLGSADVIADHSALLRLRHAERLTPDEVRAALRSAPTQPAPPPGRGAGVVALGLRLLAPRLGSTLLVSHLGRVEAPGVRALVFHPVTAGGSGVSLGAVTLDGVTTLGLRARGGNDAGLERLLAALVAAT